MKRLLMVAYHFPPLAGSSGIQRTLRFVQHLPSFGWQPLVLTVDPRAYEKTSEDLLPEVPDDVIVKRAFALDTARHLAIKGRYFSWMSRPDRWMTWRIAGVREGLRLIKEYRPDAIWTTYPIATAHMIGAELHRRSGLPWIADFRDPMAQPENNYPADPKLRRAFERIESDVLHSAAAWVFTTPSAAAQYRERYPTASSRMWVVENGYDEESFAGIAAHATQPSAYLSEPRCSGEMITILHSGIVYPSERDPTALFVALRRLLDTKRLERNTVRFRFRAAVHDDLLRSLAKRHGVDDCVELCPALPYRQALQEMMDVDALLVLQAANCNAQIPAKVYEYLRAGRPILGITDPAGDTAAVLRQAGLGSIARCESADEIEALLPDFLGAVRDGRAPLPDADAVKNASRRGRTAALADILNSLDSRSSIEG